jgi:hypothetical protein
VRQSTPDWTNRGRHGSAGGTASDRGLADAEDAGEAADALALGALAGDVGALLGGELEARPELDAAGLGANSPLRGPRHDQLALELGQPGEHGHHQPAVRRGGVGPYGPELGLRVYTHLSDRYGSFHAKVISATASEAPHVLDGLVTTGADPDGHAHYTDTGGATDHVFALCHLLAYRFVPRIRDLRDRRLGALERTARFPALAPILGPPVRTDAIRESWDDLIRLAASIQARATSPSAMLKKLAAYKRQNRLDLALGELGRLERTFFTLDWLESPELRRRCHAGLNKSETRRACGPPPEEWRGGIRTSRGRARVGPFRAGPRLGRGAAARGRAQALPFVEDLDILEHRRPGLRPAAEVDVVDVLLLGRGEEALRRRVVGTVALAAHRPLDAVPLQGSAAGLGGVPDPPVTVTDRAGSRPAALQGRGQRVDAQPGPEVVG